MSIKLQKVSIKFINASNFCIIRQQRRLYNKATEEISCPQTFIVKILIIETSAATVFYSTTERRGNRQVAVETERE